jgi:hypothetical protein
MPSTHHAWHNKNEGDPKVALFCDLHLVNGKTTFPSQLNIGRKMLPLPKSDYKKFNAFYSGYWGVGK